MAQVLAVHLEDVGAFAGGQVVSGDAADQVLGQLARLQALQPGAQLAGQAQADAGGGDLAIEDPLQRFRVLD